VASSLFAGSRRERLSAIAGGVLLLAIAKTLGGFFTSAPGLPRLSFVLAPGMCPDAADTALWNLKTFGMLLPLGIAGLFVLRRERLLFMSLVLGGITIVNFVTYTSSWDIVKFATVAAISLGVLTSAAIARLLPEGTSGMAAGRRALAGALLAPTLAVGLLF